MTVSPTSTSQYVKQARALTESIRSSIPDPASQIAALLPHADYHIPEDSDAAGVIGIPGYREAGTSGLWYRTARTGTAYFLDSRNSLILAASKQVRPDYQNGVLVGALNEASGSNVISNPRGEGATTTSFPTTWGNPTGVPTGMAVMCLGRLTLRGVPGVLIKFSGTLASSGVGGRINFSGSGGPTVNYAAGTVAVLSVYAQHFSGTVPSGSLLRATGASMNAVTLASPVSTLQRAWARFYYPSAAAGTAISYGLTFAAGAVDCTIFLAMPQLEVGSVPTSIMLPPVGSPGASTRPADALTVVGPGMVAQSTLDEIAGARAAATVLRRAALGSLALACAAYQPTTLDDALSLRDAVVSRLDAEIVRAADAGDSERYTEMRRLRTSVSADLTNRAIDLPTLRESTFGANLPSMVLAQRLYRDGARHEELTQRVDPRHPAFMPRTFVARSR